MIYVTRMRWFLSVCIIAACGLSRAEDKPSYTPEQLAFFESKIRPIFVEHCYECHSANAGDDLEGGLLLDSRWGWSKGGDSGPAIVPGKIAESLVIHAVRYEEDQVSAMPPKSKLPEQQIKDLEKWVEMGAPDPREKVGGENIGKIEAFDLRKRFAEHWSWRKIENPTPPNVKNTEWIRNDIDRFVLAKLEAANIQPAKPAAKEVWLRRVFFDLIGLPPTAEQIDAFLADDSAKATQTVVDQLLQSERFGEKWARHWMDLVRYAETYGHEFDYPLSHASEYRDYLIRAFNADVPYDQFLIEHVAGDLIDKPRRHPTEDFNESVIGTGFWYFHEATHAPTDVLQNEADIIDNQLDVFGKSFLGLTVACARCHDHKFDAISAADYYALSAYIQSSCRQLYPLDPKGRIAESVGQLEKLRTKISSAIRMAKAPGAEKHDPAPYFAAASQLIQDAKDTPQAKQHDKNLLPVPDSKQVEKAAADKSLDLERLQKWIAVLTSTRPGLQTSSPAAVLAQFVKQPETAEKLAAALDRDEARAVESRKSAQLLADFSNGKLPAGWSTAGLGFRAVDEQSRSALIGDIFAKPGTVDSGVFGKRASGTLRSPTFEISNQRIHLLVKATANARARVIVDNYQMAQYNALLFRGMDLSGGGMDTKGEWQWKSFAGNLNKYIGHKAYLDFADNGDESIAIAEIWLSDGGPPTFVDPAVRYLVGGKDGLSKSWQEGLAAVRDGKRHAFIDWLLSRGLLNVAELAPACKPFIDEASAVASKIPRPRLAIAMAEGSKENAHVYVRGNPAMLGQEVPPRNLEALGSTEGNRMALARKMATIDNPLVARVMVNRVWHHLFGRGIVPSVDDFGPQGQPASHPELLDALATDFANNGWSIKSIIRKMVLSETYNQSSTANPGNETDHLAEADPTNSLLHKMRVRRLPAESIRDAILTVSGRLDQKMYGGSVATHRTEFMTGRGARGSGPLDGAGRRSVYLSIYRNFLNPFMLTFDMPSPFGPKGRRSNSNVPAQALTLMNDPFVIQQASVWADRVLRQKEWTDQQRVAAMSRAAHGIDPSDSQIARMVAFVDGHPEHGKNEKSAWADLAHALFNTKSFYFLK